MPGPRCANGGRSLLERCPGDVHPPAGLHRGHLVGLQSGQAVIQLSHPAAIVGQTLVQFTDAGPQSLGLGGQVPPLHLEPLQCLGRRGESTVVLIEGPVVTGNLVLSRCGVLLGNVESR